jgi:hypothetical protein
MTSFEPTYEVMNGTLRVQLFTGDVASRLSFEGVLDLTGMGEVVGLEILDFGRQLDATVEPARSSDAIRWSYYAEEDAFYLHLAGQHAPVQKTVTGVALIDSRKNLIGVDVAL